MSQVASATARASASSRSSISRYSALSAWVHEVDVPTIRYPGPRVRGERGEVALRLPAGLVVEAVADEREAAAHLLRDDRR